MLQGLEPANFSTPIAEMTGSCGIRTVVTRHFNTEPPLMGNEL